LVITNLQHSTKHLNATQVYTVFSGQINTWKEIDGSNSTIQVWVFAASEDIQSIFDQVVMNGSPVTSTARLASTPGEMTEAISKDVDAIGIINRRLMPVGTIDIFKVTKMPVLAFTGSNPSAELNSLISCLQK
jgi:ABC-type phosphate transport system substrate-binding protein